MVQAAAQAQAVVAAAKSKGDGLVPMNSAQITALSQIQAQAIVHARKSQGTPQQIQTQIQLQAQALVHAHTQVRRNPTYYRYLSGATWKTYTPRRCVALRCVPRSVIFTGTNRGGNLSRRGTRVGTRSTPGGGPGIRTTRQLLHGRHGFLCDDYHGH
jgi:hypothetical protein